MTSGLADVSSGSLGDSHFFLALSLKVFGVLPFLCTKDLSTVCWKSHQASLHKPVFNFSARLLCLLH